VTEAERMIVAGVRLGANKPARYVQHEPAGIVSRPLADAKAGHQLGSLVDARPQVNIAFVVALPRRGPLSQTMFCEEREPQSY